MITHVILSFLNKSINTINLMQHYNAFYRQARIRTCRLLSLAHMIVARRPTRRKGDT